MYHHIMFHRGMRHRKKDDLIRMSIRAMRVKDGWIWSAERFHLVQFSRLTIWFDMAWFSSREFLGVILNAWMNLSILQMWHFLVDGKMKIQDVSWTSSLFKRSAGSWSKIVSLHYLQRYYKQFDIYRSIFKWNEISSIQYSYLDFLILIVFCDG